MTIIAEKDLWMFNEGSHTRLYEILGCQPLTGYADPGRRFAVWAPNATYVSVAGDFNQWGSDRDQALQPQGSSGIWAGVVPDAKVGDRYKYRLTTRDGRSVERADPLAFAAELPPHTASVVTDLTHQWGDGDWMRNRHTLQRHDRAISMYEMHVGSWRHAEAYRSLTWAELAEPLADHLNEMGFTHVELLPIMEHPFYGSWGYQTTSFYAPTARYGLPTDFMGFVDALHQRGIGVVLDWVPSHFPSDDFALGGFDGTPLYEHADPQEGWHPDWKSHVFNFGRHEVKAFLTSSAHYWMDRYHVDGIRVDAVASMLYRDYSRAEGEWIPNIHGGRENLEAIGFLQHLNGTIGERFPDVITVAEESTAFPGVTRPVSAGGLGFHYKWDMGWMHDTLSYLERDPIHRRFHHNEITFRSVYAFSENYVLGLSHDEVTHGKGSLLAKMAGDAWQQFANLRVLYGNQWFNPGKKLLFMGQEFGQGPEWNHDHPVAWSQLGVAAHAGIRDWVVALNTLYASEPSLHVTDNEPADFSWVVVDDGENSVLAWLRHAEDHRPVLCVFNLTPIPRLGYRLGVPVDGTWEVLANSDNEAYGGSGVRFASTWIADGHGAHGRPHSLVLDIPPLAAVALAPRLPAR